MGWNKDSLVGIAKATHMSKARNSFTTSHGQEDVEPFAGE